MLKNLTLLLFPLFFPTYLKERGKKYFWKILILFTINILLISIWAFIECSIKNIIFTSNHRYCFSYKIPYKYVYFGMYLNFSYWIISYYYYINKNKLNFLKKLIFYIFNFLLLFFIYYSGGKATLITWILIFILFIEFVFLNLKKQKILKIFFLKIFIIIIIGFITFQNQKFKNFFSKKIEKISQNYSFSERIVLWKCAIKVFKKNPILGSPLNKEVQILRSCYKQNPKLNKSIDYNSHNNYLSSSVNFGIIGLISLLIMLFYPFFWSLKYEYKLYTLFLSLFIFSTFSESMFERQIGLIFYSYFNIVLFSNYFFKKKY